MTSVEYVSHVTHIPEFVVHMLANLSIPCSIVRSLSRAITNCRTFSYDILNFMTAAAIVLFEINPDTVIDTFLFFFFLLSKLFVNAFLLFRFGEGGVC